MLDFFIPLDATAKLYEKAAYSNRFLSVACDGRLRKFMNGTNPDDYGIITESVHGGCSADSNLYQAPIDVDKIKKKLPDFKGPFLGPVVAMVNSYCDSTCEGLAKGFAELDTLRGNHSAGSAVTGFDGTLGSFGMDGKGVLLPSNIYFAFPHGRSLDKNNVIQLDSDYTGRGGVVPTKPLIRNKENVIAFAEQGFTRKGDVELDWAVSVAKDLLAHPRRP